MPDRCENVTEPREIYLRAGRKRQDEGDDGEKEAGLRTNHSPAWRFVADYRTSSSQVAAIMASSPASAFGAVLGAAEVWASTSSGTNVVSWKAISSGLNRRSRIGVPLCHCEPSTGGQDESVAGTMVNKEVPPALDAEARVFQVHR